MLENEINKETEPQVENENIPEEVNTISQNKGEVTIPVKFNKEIRELTVDEAARLAQKGLKYELIHDDYALLKELSDKSGKNVGSFLRDIQDDLKQKRADELSQKCGDEALIEHILELENISKCENAKGFEELKKYFKDFNSPEDLPQKVLESSRLKGTLLLDEYLRYLLIEKFNAEQAKIKQNKSEGASIGSQLNRKSALSPETEEFLKGLWK